MANETEISEYDIRCMECGFAVDTVPDEWDLVGPLMCDRCEALARRDDELYDRWRDEQMEEA